MSVWSDNAALVATTRATYLRQQTNAVLADLERDLRDAAREDKARLIAEAAERLEAMGA